VILGRLARLSPSCNEALSVASVIGRDFARESIEGASDLDFDAAGDAIDEGRRSGMIKDDPRGDPRFAHVLIQEAIYEALGRSPRARLHRRVAQWLEKSWPRTRLDEQAPLLAHHWEEAGDAGRAADYYERASVQARERSAYAEAVAHVTRGLELLERLPETPERARRELALQLSLGLSLQIARGLGAPGVERAFARARELCREAGDVRQLFPTLWGLWLYCQQGHDYTASKRLAEELLRLAETTREPGFLLQSQHAAWTTAAVRGELLAAREHIRIGLEIYRPEEHHEQAQRFGSHDPGVCGIYSDAWMLALLGQPDQASRRLREAIELAESLGHPFTRVICRMFAIYVSLTLRDAPGVGEHAGALAAVASELGSALSEPSPTIQWLQGWGLLQGGERAEGVARMREGVEAMLAQNDLFTLPQTLGILCEAYATADQPDEGLALLAKSRAQLDSMGGNYNEAEIQSVRGELLSTQSLQDEAEAAIRQALEVARYQQAGLLELRAATSLGRLLRERGNRDEARSQLSEVYDRFSEGFETPDLEEATALLEELR
jgi:predicted ATPase